MIGSPKYMAPEQILGKKVDERADIYSLGVIMYEMLSGNPPYSRGDHMSVMYQHVQGKAQPLNEANPKVPREIADVVDQDHARSTRRSAIRPWRNCVWRSKLPRPRSGRAGWRASTHS